MVFNEEFIHILFKVIKHIIVAILKSLSCIDTKLLFSGLLE